MKEKQKWIIWSLAAAIVLVIGAGVIFGLRIRKNTKEARAAAEDFAQCLTDGRLAWARMKYYQSSSEEEREVITDDAGTPVVQFITEQELAELYGEELVLAGREEEESVEERFFAAIMRYSSITVDTGITMGDEGQTTVVLTGPDLLNWADSLSAEKLNELAQAEDVVSWVEEFLRAGDVPERTVQFVVPMQKVRDQWRFDMTDEMESALFGGL